MCFNPKIILPTGKGGTIEPQKLKLVSFLTTLRVDKMGSPSISVPELHAWCEQRKHVPDDVDEPYVDEPYVLALYIEAESSNPDEQDLKLVISTQRLLSLMKKKPSYSNRRNLQIALARLSGTNCGDKERFTSSTRSQEY